MDVCKGAVSRTENMWSTDNYMQYPMTNHDGQEYIKRRMCVYMYTKRSHLAVQQK